eukprot:8304193-Ditylum_brightwellii.AAC.1
MSEDVKVQIPYFLTNLPLFVPETVEDVMANVDAAFAAANGPAPKSVLDPQNIDLFSAHYTLGHIGFQLLKELMLLSHYKGDDTVHDPLIHTKQKSTIKCAMPKCKS